MAIHQISTSPVSNGGCRQFSFTLKQLLTIAIFLPLAACTNSGGSLELASKPFEPSSLLQAHPDDAGKAKGPARTNQSQSSSNTVDSANVMQRAKKLKSEGHVREAFALISPLAQAQDASRTVLVEAGLLALEAGQTTKAKELLLRASPNTSKDWRLLSGMGISEATLGEQAEAQKYFRQALEISPNNQAVKNNLALSLILDHKPAEAERVLTDAAKSDLSKPRVLANLALAKALQQDAATGNP